MKISRNKVNSCNEVNRKVSVQETSKVDEVVSDEDIVSKSLLEAKEHIMSAIDSLSSSANISNQSKEAIANLSVVYFDLQ